MKLDLNGRVVAITGASGGLGDAVAVALLRRGARVALLDLRQDVVEAQAERLGGKDVARGWQVDVRDLAAMEQTFRDVVDHFGKLDVVIAGAGIGNVIGTLAATDEKDWERTIDINLNGVWRTFKAAAPHVLQQKGHLMAIASMASFVHSPLHGSYTGSKAGVWGLCDSLRLEFRHQGVTVGSVHPTFFKTPMVDEALSDPGTQRLWNGFQGFFKLTTLDVVVAAIVDGIERRRAHVVAPRSAMLAPLIPGILQKIVDRFGFGGSTVPEAIRLLSARTPDAERTAVTVR